MGLEPEAMTPTGLETQTMGLGLAQGEADMIVRKEFQCE